MTNLATATAGGTTSNEDTATVERRPAPGADAGQDAPTPDDLRLRRRRHHYSYLVTNTGNVSLAGPVTSPTTSLRRGLPARDHGRQPQRLLDPGESITCTATYTVTQADLNAGT